MLTKNLKTKHGDCSTVAEITHTDNGQTVIRLTAELAGHTHEHTVTVGAEDGYDALAELTDGGVALLQQHLDQARDKAARILAARVAVKHAAARLT
jgi:hypothetical protein